MPAHDAGEKQPADYQASVIPCDMKKRVVMEAGIQMGWEGIVGCEGIFIGKEGFGTSGPAATLAKEYGFTVENVLAKIAEAGL